MYYNYIRVSEGYIYTYIFRGKQVMVQASKSWWPKNPWISLPIWDGAMQTIWMKRQAKLAKYMQSQIYRTKMSLCQYFIQIYVDSILKTQKKNIFRVTSTQGNEILRLFLNTCLWWCSPALFNICTLKACNFANYLLFIEES